VSNRVAISRPVRALLVSVCALLGALGMSASALAAGPEAPDLAFFRLQATEVELSARLSPDASAPVEGGEYWFIYKKGTECAGENETTHSPYAGQPNEQTSPDPAKITGLTQGTEYSVCLVVENGKAESAHSTPVTFTTAIAPPTPETLAPVDISAKYVEVQGVLNPHEAVNEATSYQFAYRESPSECLTGGVIKETSSSYSAMTTRRETVIGYLEGLQPNTTYTACLITWNSAFETVIGNPVTFTTHEAFALNVYVVGEGEVNSFLNLEGTCAQVGPGLCSNYFYGPVGLTETPKPGYVFAGWIGCAYLASPPDSCEVDVTSRMEVAAVFLKEGTEGKEGKEGSEGKSGKEGKEGKQGNEGKQGSIGAPGEPGANGAAGANGSNGAQGSAGPAGPAGKEGPAGKVEVVTCTKKGKKQHCTTKTESGTVSFTTGSAHATLSRHGAVYATGSAASVRGHLSLRLEPLRSLRPGKYTLTLVGGAGKHETIRSESFTLS
jgi:Collagen triple helix repeat (20 copies)